MRHLLYLVVICCGMLFLACGTNDNAPAESDSQSETADGDTQAAADGDSSPAPDGDAPVVFDGDDDIPSRPLSDKPDTTFEIGPYLMHTTQTSVTIMWRTHDEQDGAVSYRPANAADTAEESVSDPTPTLIHKFTLDKLDANTSYVYQVKSGSRHSDEHTFYTAPEETAPIRVSVISDTQEDTKVFEQLIPQLAAFEPFFVLHSGDTVQNFSYDNWVREFFTPMRAMMHQVPIYIAAGNHERDSDLFYSMVSYPTTPGPLTRGSYGFRYGNTFFLAIDTTRPFGPELDENGHLSVLSEFLVEQMESEEAQSATWRVAFGHFPGYTEGWWPPDLCHYDGTPRVRDWLYPQLEQHHFHVYISGHAHQYERGHVGNLLTLTVGGGGGEMDEFCREQSQIDVSYYVHHMMRMTAGTEALHFEARDLDEKTIDSATLITSDYGRILTP